MSTISSRTQRCKKEEPAMIKISTAFVGLDLGDKRSNVFILDQEGELIEETRIPPPPNLPSGASSPACHPAG
jgi:hypothetical protein